MSKNEKVLAHIALLHAPQWVAHKIAKDRDGGNKFIAHFVALCIGLVLSWMIEKL